MSRDNLILIAAGIGLAVFGFWFFNDILGSLLGGMVGLEAVRKKKQASKVKSEEADKRQKVHEKKAGEHADKAKQANKKAKKATKKKTKKKTGEDLENAFRNRSR